MVLGADGAGVVERVGEGTSRFSAGDEVFGQLLVAPIGSAGTYAEYVAVSADAPLARIPSGLDDVLAAALPTAGGAGLALVESLEPLANKTVLLVGAGGGVGAFAIQFAVNAGARVIANVRAPAAERMRGYGAAETFDHAEAPLVESVKRAHPDGIDALIDLVSDADNFAALVSLVRPGGTAVSTQYVADPEALATAGVTAINFALHETPELLERVADALIEGRIVAPPIRRITLDEVPGTLITAESGHVDGKTVIALEVPDPVSSHVLGAAHTGFTVVDLERSLSFWRDTLGFEMAMRASLSGEPLEQITGVRDGAIDFAILNIPGGHQLELVQYRAPPERRHVRLRPSDVGSVHLSVFVSDMQAVIRAAAAAGWHAAGTPQTMRNGPATGATFEYLTDPDGTILELIQRPSRPTQGAVAQGSTPPKSGPVPDCSRRCASCVRDFTSSFRNALRKWYSTVLELMNSFAAISWLVAPCAARRETCASCGVSSSRVSTLRLRARSPVARSSTRARSAYPSIPNSVNSRWAFRSWARASRRLRLRRSHSP